MDWHWGAGWDLRYLKALGGEFGEALDGDDDGELGFSEGANDAGDVGELVEEGFEEVGYGHGVELVREGEHALVVFGFRPGAGVVVEAAEGLSAKCGLGAGLFRWA